MCHLRITWKYIPENSLWDVRLQRQNKLEEMKEQLPLDNIKLVNTKKIKIEIQRLFIYFEVFLEYIKI